MVPCHTYYIYETWISKEMGRGEVLKSSYGGKPQREEVIFMWAVDPSRYHDNGNARTIWKSVQC